ncbi:23S rRNA (pseudouridine(1915)-N(3))-methyltransferase RlmH [Caldanaerobacter sp.]|uniref:23S rRNA (pseudouridine(1915)-N(3))-methyltransferase RlmH n=1 Tax=Caldanaerobacter sp. TaxID=2930036 RepID=UPI003C77D4A8
MNYKFIILSRQIEPFYEKAIEEYFKRLKRFCSVSLSVYKTHKKVPSKELEKFLKVVISNDGKTISSEEFALKIKEFEMKSMTNIAFLIGKEFEAGDEKLVISRMKLSEGLTATLLAEQLYRAYKILRNEPYHK